MSNINPQSIDGTYPIAGQDNNSQGFRDNFTNTVNNFTFAAAELSDLQQNAVLKAALGSVGQTGTPTNDLNYAFLTHPQLKGAVETAAQNLTVTAGAFVVNWESAHFQSVALTATTGDASFTFTNWPTSGYFTKLRLQVTVSGGTRVLTFPSGVNINISTIQGYTSGTSVSLANGVYVFEFSTVNFGANVIIQDVLRSSGLSTLSGNLIINDQVGAASAGANLTVKGTIEYKSQDQSNNASVNTSTKSLTLAPGGDQFLLLNINGNCAIGYNAAITPGHQTTVHVKNSAGALAYVIVPNENNNTGNAFVGLATGITGTFVFTSYGTDAGNVFVTVSR